MATFRINDTSATVAQLPYVIVDAADYTWAAFGTQALAAIALEVYRARWPDANANDWHIVQAWNQR